MERTVLVWFVNAHPENVGCPRRECVDLDAGDTPLLLVAVVADAAAFPVAAVALLELELRAEMRINELGGHKKCPSKISLPLLRHS